MGATPLDPPITKTETARSPECWPPSWYVRVQSIPKWLFAVWIAALVLMISLITGIYVEVRAIRYAAEEKDSLTRFQREEAERGGQERNGDVGQEGHGGNPADVPGERELPAGDGAAPAGSPR